MKTLEKTLLVGIVWILAFFCSVTFVHAQKQEIRLLTGGMGGSWYSLGVAVGEVLQKQIPGIQVTTVTGGSQSSAKAIEQGKTELALIFANDAHDSIQGKTPFTTKNTKLRDIARSLVTPYQMMVYKDSPIKSFRDLKGKRVGTMARGSGSEAQNKVILKAYGISYEDLAKVQFGTMSDLVGLMQDKHLDAIGTATGIPTPQALEIGATRPIRFLNIDPEVISVLVKSNPGYTSYKIPAGTYASQGHPEEIRTVVIPARLMCHADLAEDLVYKITKTYVEKMDEISLAAVSMKGLTAKELSEDAGLPFHPGAAKYFRSIGLRK